MFKRLAKLAGHGSGAVQLLRKLNQNRVRILMYHRFPRCSERDFQRQCAYLASRYRVVSLEDAADRLLRNESVADLAVITVDDGYADFHDVAYPVLRRYKLPATLFVTTGFVNRTDWMPGDRVRYHFARPGIEHVRVTDDAGTVRSYATKSKQNGAELREYLKRIPERTKRRMLAEMDGNLPVPEGAALPAEYRPCTWDQLRELAAGGISIGAHTVTHPILSRLEHPDEVEREILASKAELENRLQRPVTSFAYPNGLREDISQASVDCVRANFQAAVTAVYGLNAPGSDVHELFRLPCEPDFPVRQLARLLAGPVRLSRPPQAALATATY